MFQKEEPHDGRIESAFHTLHMCILPWHTEDRRALADRTIGALATETLSALEMTENIRTPFFLRLQVIQPRERPATFTMTLGLKVVLYSRARLLARFITTFRNTKDVMDSVGMQIRDTRQFARFSS
jgi:hypothetical protein